jgi:hypothetical protein
MHCCTEARLSVEFYLVADESLAFALIAALVRSMLWN